MAQGPILAWQSSIFLDDRLSVALNRRSWAAEVSTPPCDQRDAPPAFIQGARSFIY